MASGHTEGVRRALLIGINEYTERPLRGCVGDAKGMAALLHERFGFANEHITLLLDGEASLARVEQEMQRLLDVTTSSDTVCFFFAGHGTVFEQSDGTESTGFGTTFCLQEDPREDLYDDDFGVWLDALATRTDNVVLLIDCCHSGTITRSDEERAPHLAPLRQTKGPSKAAVAARTRRGVQRSITSVASDKHTLIAACRDDQLASETFLDDTRTTTSGALTLTLCRALRDAKDGDTWRDVFDRIAPEVRKLAAKEDGSQEPQLAGQSDRVLFGLQQFTPVSPFRITHRARVNVELDAGALHGVTKGTVFFVYPEGTKAGEEGEPLGRVQVAQVHGTTSRARILNEKPEGAIVAGARAVSSVRDSVEMVLGIQNTSTNSALRNAVSLTLLREKSEGEFVPVKAPADGTLPQYDSGSRVAVQITSTAKVPLFVVLFYFDPDGSVQRLRKSSTFIVPAGGSFSIGTVPRDYIRLRSSLPSAPAHLKIFASTAQVDLDYLERTSAPERGESPGFTLDTSDDWTTVTASLTLNGTQALASGKTVDVSGATATARGLKGKLAAVPVRRAVSTRGDGDPILDALQAEGIMPQQSFVLSDASEDGDGTRSADGAPVLELEVPDAGEGMAQVAMVTDEDGLIRWHFATAPSDRSADGETPSRTRTFVIPTTPTEVEGERGLLTMIGKKLIDIYLFPVAKAVTGVFFTQRAHPMELKRVPYRARTFTPDDYASNEHCSVIDDAAWKRLASGRALLMIHGTNSAAHSAFAALPRTVVEEFHTLYEGRVFAFDHPTLTHTPTQNIEHLFQTMPDGTTLDVDIICHSRGGLVSRVLAERQEQILTTGRSVRVNKVIFVGSPNSGTRLCEEDLLPNYFDSVTNLLAKYPVPGAADLMAAAMMFLKIASAGLYTALTGIHSMQPGGLYQQWLNGGTKQPDTRYFALTSDFKPTDLALARLASYVLAGRAFGNARNDLIVPTDGVFGDNGSSAFPIKEFVAFEGTDGIPHTGFFGDARVAAHIGRWLRA